MTRSIRTMTLSSMVLVLLQVCSLHLTVVAMPTCPLEGKKVQSAHHLLRDMGAEFPAHCLAYNMNISFPDSALPAAIASHSQCRQVLWVVHETLQKAGLVFEDHDLPVGKGGVTWDEQKLNKFKHIQLRLEEQGSCLSSIDASGVLSSYFSNMTAVLEQQDSAACGWMVLRKDLIWVLESALHLHRTCFTWGTTH